jgi:hypothetical protein
MPVYPARKVPGEGGLYGQLGTASSAAPRKLCRRRPSRLWRSARRWRWPRAANGIFTAENIRCRPAWSRRMFSFSPEPTSGLRFTGDAPMVRARRTLAGLCDERDEPVGAEVCRKWPDEPLGRRLARRAGTDGDLRFVPSQRAGTNYRALQRALSGYVRIELHARERS